MPVLQDHSTSSHAHARRRLWQMIVVGLLWGMGAVLAFGQQAEANPPPAASYPVVLGHHDLFLIHAGVGAVSAAGRARAISARLARLAGRTEMSPRIVVTGDSGRYELTAGDLIVMEVTADDAAAAGTSAPMLAAQDAHEITQALVAYRRAHSMTRLLLSVVYTLLSVIALVAAIMALSWIAQRIRALLRKHRRSIPSIRVHRLVLAHRDNVVRVLQKGVTGLQIFVSALLVYAILPVVFSFFPVTRSYSSVLLQFLLRPVTDIGTSLLSFAPNLLSIVVIAVLTYYAVRFLRILFTGLENRTIELSWFYPEWATPTYKIVRFFAIVVAIIAAYPYIPGSQTPAFKGISLIIGVFISFSSSSSVANIIAGVILTYTRAYQVGDRVQIGDNVGDILERTLLVTRLKTIKHVVVTVPNTIVLNSHILNFSGSGRSGDPLILHTSVTIGYDAPWRQVHALLLAAANGCEGCLSDPAPFVLQTSLDDFFVTYQINAYTRHPEDMAAIYSRLHERIQDRFNEAGVEILSPHFHAVRDGNRVGIPADYRPAGYEAPAFRVHVDRS